MMQNPFPNLSNRIERKAALELCSSFYQFFYYPDIDLEILKHITWEDIYELYDPKSAISQALSDFPRIIDILKYIRLSHNSYLQLIKEDDNLRSLADYISFPEYDNLSENALSYLQGEFKKMSILDFYKDSISEPIDICYPLQYLNIFFYKDSFQFLDAKNPDENLYRECLCSLKKFPRTLKSYNLLEFKTNILEKKLRGSRTKYFIPRCSILSFTFVLSAFNSKEIPIEFQHRILSDFIINVCVANNCEPYEILTYLSAAKHHFSPEIVVKSRRKIFSDYQKELNHYRLKPVGSLCC